MKFKMLKVRNSSQDDLSCAMLGCAGPSYATVFTFTSSRFMASIVSTHSYQGAIHSSIRRLNQGALERLSDRSKNKHEN